MVRTAIHPTSNYGKQQYIIFENMVRAAIYHTGKYGRTAIHHMGKYGKNSNSLYR